MSAWRHSTSSITSKSVLTCRTSGSRLAAHAAAAQGAAAAAVPVGSACTITTHRRWLASRSIRRQGLSRTAQPTNTNLTAARARTVTSPSRHWLVAPVAQEAAKRMLPQKHAQPSSAC